MKRKGLEFVYTRLTSPGHRAAAFSLAELVVSMGVLVLLLAMAGQVMNLTVTATGQAQALADVNQQIRILEQSLRDDLARVDRNNSLMLIQGNPIQAYWTQAGKDADDDNDPRTGYPHGTDPERTNAFIPDNLALPRADILMFFTERQATSNVHQNVRAGLVQVTYGHAEFGEYDLQGDFTIEDDIERYPIDLLDDPYNVPAEEWLLARRGVLISPTLTGAPLVSPPPVTLDDPRILRGETDVIEGFDYENRVLRSSENASPPAYLPPIFEKNGSEFRVPHARSIVDPAPPPSIAYAVNQHMLPNCASFKVEWCLDPKSNFVNRRLASENKIYWIDQGAPFDINGNPPSERFTQLESLYQAFDDAQEQSTNVGPLRSTRLNELISDPLGFINDSTRYSLEERFGDAGSIWVTGTNWVEWPTNPPRLHTAVFGGRRGQSPNDVGEDIFPRALRITIDVYDNLGRLDNPVRHVMIIPVGKI